MQRGGHVFQKCSGYAKGVVSGEASMDVERNLEGFKFSRKGVRFWKPDVKSAAQQLTQVYVTVVAPSLFSFFFPRRAS